MSAANVIIAPQDLSRFVACIVSSAGSALREAELVATNLVLANLSGHDSHGVGMIPQYVDFLGTGGLKPNQHARITGEFGSMLMIDGCKGYGQVIGHEAMKLGIERACTSGLALVALRDSHHIGRIGQWAEDCAAAGLVSLHFVNALLRPLVAPFGGADARFATNPFCCGIPRAGEPPVILDFATSMIAQGKARVALNKGEQLAPDCLIDDQGRPTQEPRYTVLPPWGALLTFGGHKGFGLALMCELLGGALAAGMTQRDSDSSQKRVLNGMFSVLVDPAALGDRGSFEAEALAFLDWVQASPPREGFGPVQVAGDPERRMRAERSALGVPVDATTWQEILAAADKLGVSPAQVQREAGLD